MSATDSFGGRALAKFWRGTEQRVALLESGETAWMAGALRRQRSMRASQRGGNTVSELTNTTSRCVLARPQLTAPGNPTFFGKR